MFYHADYYRIIVIVYDYECSQHHASFHIYVRMGSEPGTPLPHPPTTPTHTLTNEPMKKTYESQREKMKRKKKKKKKKKEKLFLKRSACN